MIATLNGLVFAKTPLTVILDVNGVGYELLISGRTYDALPETGSTCFLFVQTVVREDAITLRCNLVGVEVPHQGRPLE